MPTNGGLALKPKVGGAGQIGPDGASVERQAGIIRVDFAQPPSRPAPGRARAPGVKRGSGLAIGWLLNAGAALISVLIALASDAAPSALTYFLAGALAGLAAQGAGALVALAPPRRDDRGTGFGDEWLTALAFLCLVASIVAATLGFWATLAGLL